jgi:osmoprotectant transport system ATP-binding protein
VREAFVLGTRIGLIKDGQMILLGPPALLLETDDPEARAFARCFQESSVPENAR